MIDRKHFAFVGAVGFLLVAALGLLLTGRPPADPSPAPAEGENPPALRTMTALATGEVVVPATGAVVQLGIENTGTAPGEVQQENLRRREAVRGRLTASGHVRGNDLVLSGVRFEPLTGPEVAGWAGVSFYRAWSGLRVAVSPLAVEAVIGEAVAAGSVRVESVTYTLNNPDEVTLEALRLAQKQAGERLDALAAAHGVKVRSVKRETGQVWTEEMLDVTRESLPTGEVAVRVHLRASYQF